MVKVASELLINIYSPYLGNFAVRVAQLRWNFRFSKNRFRFPCKPYSIGAKEPYGNHHANMILVLFESPKSHVSIGTRVVLIRKLSIAFVSIM